MVYISYFDKGTERWEVTASDRGVTGVSLCGSFVRAQENEYSQAAARELSRYLAGETVAFTAPLAPEGTTFQRQVWQALQEIPYGSSVCYSQVAERIGRPTAVRAVAQAIGRNPCLILIPCHRVLGKDGTLTGFSAGLDLKKRLLDLEGIPYRE